MEETGGANLVPAPPQFSADRLWWWTGTQWVPAQPPPRSPRKISDRAMILLVILVIGVVALLVPGFLSLNEESQRFDELYCEEYGVDDPDC